MTRTLRFSHFLAIVAAAILAKTTWETGMDFRVYHDVARRLLMGGPLYSFQHDDIMMFKYPPWWAPAFFPFALLEGRWGYALWGVLNSVAFLWLFHRLAELGVSRRNLIIVGAVSFATWNTHALAGQISVLLVAGSLALYRDRHAFASLDRKGDWRRTGLLWLLSAKILTLAPIVFVARPYRRWQTAALTCATFLGLSAWTAHLDPSGWSVFEGWQEAIKTVPHPTLGPVISVAMREAQSLVSLVWRLAQWDVLNHGVLQVALVLQAVVVMGLGWRFSAHVPDVPRFSLALALMTTVQPLTGFHAFVMAVPMHAFALQHAGPRTPWAILGLVMTYAITQKSLGTVGSWAEFCSVKSWGVYLGALVLVQSFRKRHA